ncbi:MAG TPA: hypothetical protein VGO09_03875 [Flavisolibacter sp.]|nr:hypothetical protein [Flavisolibacter sp.]
MPQLHDHVRQQNWCKKSKFKLQLLIRTAGLFNILVQPLESFAFGTTI